MAKRRFRPEDGLRLKTATDPDLSADGRRVAFVVTDTDVERDRPRASVWVAPLDGSAPARRGQEPALVSGPPLARVHLVRG
jgi:dipeptidyl aminopeptidase/acylaminoacyl peptidase